ncbi:MAG TPA: GAF domain-containing protein [Gaiellaceae bacterium]|nr:GAF domain-containing protein [Gaiellaceae bacterium]
MTEIDALLHDLLVQTGASRVTLRQDVPGDVFPVTHEALSEGVPSIRGVATPDMSRQPVVREVQQGRQVVQDDCLLASEEPHFRAMLELYGGMRAQIVTPVTRAERVVAIVSLHQLGRARRWSEQEVEAARQTAERVGRLL